MKFDDTPKTKQWVLVYKIQKYKFRYFSSENASRYVPWDDKYEMSGWKQESVKGTPSHDLEFMVSNQQQQKVTVEDAVASLIEDLDIEAGKAEDNENVFDMEHDGGASSYYNKFTAGGFDGTLLASRSQKIC